MVPGRVQTERDPGKMRRELPPIPPPQVIDRAEEVKGYERPVNSSGQHMHLTPTVTHG